MSSSPQNNNAQPPFPWAFLGFGFLYAWGYALWETPALGTVAVSAGGFDLSWLVSAITVVVALGAISMWGRTHDLDELRAPYVALPVCGMVGTLLSVIGPITPEGLSTAVAVSSGVLTGFASALCVSLWSLALSRLNTQTFEVVVPASFLVSAVCALLVPTMATIPALVTALLLVASGSLLLWVCKRQLARGLIDSRHTEDVVDDREHVGSYAPSSVVRMLVYSVVAWGLSCIVSALLSKPAGFVGGADLTAFFGFVLAILYASAIIRFAIRVDYQALASLTLPPFVLATLLCAIDTPASRFVGQALSVMIAACFEIVLLLFFIRLSQTRRTWRRTFWVAVGSGAAYLGVMLGQLAVPAIIGVASAPGDRTLWCLVVACAYVFAMLIVPQRLPYVPERVRDANATVARCDGDAADGAVTRCSASAEDTHNDAVSLAVDRVATAYGLSTREAQVCELIARGRSQAYIRDVLFLSKNTVSTHARRLYAKLAVHSKQELIDLVESYR